MSYIHPVAEALLSIKDEIQQLELRHQRQPGSVTLLAVSKTKPAELVRAACAAGQLHFGENYADEGAAKVDELANPALIWHFIGGIQSNKTKLIANRYQWVHSIDRPRIAERLASQRSAELPPLNICLQVNADAENSKFGCPPSQLESLASHVASIDHLNLRGIMAIPAPRKSIAEQRDVFAQLRGQFELLQQQHPTMDTFSCGMSGDMEAAIAEGSTIVRIGTAIFGARDKPH